MPSFNGSGLDAIRTVSNPPLRDEFKQEAAFIVVQEEIAMVRQRDAYLHRMLEADLTRQPVCMARRFCHHHSNQIVGQQVDPNLLDRHVRVQAT